MANYDTTIQQFQDDLSSSSVKAGGFGNGTRTILKYPLNNQQNYGGTITFRAKEREPLSLGAKAFELLKPEYDNITQSLADPESVSVDPRQSDNFRASALERRQSKTDIARPEIGTGRKCTLYLPAAIQIQDKVSYSNIDLGVLGSTIRQGLVSDASVRDMASAVGTEIKNTFGSLISSLQQGGVSEEAQVAALKVFGGSSAVSGAISTTTGIALNPNRRSMLQGPELRNFTFTFKLIPTSPAEAESIEKIIQFFREEMYPDAVETGDTGVSAVFRYPALFDIVMRYRTANGGYKKVATQLLPCQLHAVDVNYNQSGMAFHKDGKPQEAQLTLNFTEERTLNKYDVATRGY